jgi:proline dehydrogenase
MTPPPSTTEPRLRDRAIARSLPLMPRSLVRRVSAPYIAGETLDSAMAAVQSLADEGMGTTVDVLGENITLAEQARATRDEYVALLDRLAALGNADLVNVSVKLTAVGLAFDRALARELTLEIVEHAGRLGGFVRIDMEDTPYTDATLDVYRWLRGLGHDHVGVVLQAYLRRSLDDAAQLAEMGARVRVVKGIYVEPESLAFRDMGTINGNFVAVGRLLAEAGCHVAFATHDAGLVRATADMVAELELPHEQYEYQMLLGVQEGLRQRVLADGHAVRVYVPFGARWYEYSLRRLRENPRVAGHVAADVVRGMGRRIRS